MTTKEAIQAILDVFAYEHKECVDKKKREYRTEKRIRLDGDKFTAECESNPLDYMHSKHTHPEDIIEERTEWWQMKDWCDDMGYALQHIGSILSEVDSSELDKEYEELLDNYQD